MTDNNYKLTLIFHKSNKAPYINVTAISSDKKKKKKTKISNTSEQREKSLQYYS